MAILGARVFSIQARTRFDIDENWIHDRRVDWIRITHCNRVYRTVDGCYQSHHRRIAHHPTHSLVKAASSSRRSKPGNSVIDESHSRRCTGEQSLKQHDSIGYRR